VWQAFSPQWRDDGSKKSSKARAFIHLQSPSGNYRLIIYQNFLNANHHCILSVGIDVDRQ